MWILRGERKGFSIEAPQLLLTHMPCHIGEEELGEIDQKDSLYPPKDTSQMAQKGRWSEAERCNAPKTHRSRE